MTRDQFIEATANGSGKMNVYLRSGHVVQAKWPWHIDDTVVVFPKHPYGVGETQRPITAEFVAPFREIVAVETWG